MTNGLNLRHPIGALNADLGMLALQAGITHLNMLSWTWGSTSFSHIKRVSNYNLRSRVCVHVYLCCTNSTEREREFYTFPATQG